jgi:hypothetical protein
VDPPAETCVYQSSGIRIASEIPLSVPKVEGAHTGGIDVTVVMGEPRPQAFERPSDDLVAELVVDDYPMYAIGRVAEGYVCRIMGVADFAINTELDRVVCHPVPGGRHEVLPIVVSGTITAFLLAMGGRLVLHASAVELSGHALAFVGISGQGKSTMAAMFCADGALLVTDDILPLEFGPGPDGREAVYCLRSGSEIRLREKSAPLADRFGPESSIRITADERHAVSPPPTRLDQVPLSAIVLPRPDRQHLRVSARIRPPGEASLWLARCQRIEGWQGRDHLRQQFIDVGRVLAVVPVFEVSVPWGPPFADELPDEILAECGLGGTLGWPP